MASIKAFFFFSRKSTNNITMDSLFNIWKHQTRRQREKLNYLTMWLTCMQSKQVSRLCFLHLYVPRSSHKMFLAWLSLPVIIWLVELAASIRRKTSIASALTELWCMHVQLTSRSSLKCVSWKLSLLIFFFFHLTLFVAWELLSGSRQHFDGPCM